ncbi:TolC family protein [Ohtaekwangia sp.]|uniref:TolC family protein n=1 Tax=Ohtaekwangia sp. TaxID=2066019 RepID=UPI002F93A10C
MKTKNFRSVVITTLMCHALITSYAQENYSLENCKRIALENNKKIKASKNEIEASLAFHKAVAAEALPKLDGSVTGVHLGDPLGGAFNGMIPNQFGIGSVTLTQPVYAGGKIRYAKQSAAKGIAIQEERKNIVTADLLADVEKAYWQVVQVNEKIVLAKRFKEMLLSLHHDLQNSFEAGLIYKNDLLRVEVTLNEAELNLVKANDGLVMAKLNLAQILGNAGNTEFTLSDSVTGNFTELPSLSYISADNRPEVRLLTRAVEAGELQGKMLNAERKPVLGVSLSGVAVSGKGVNFENGNNHMTTYYGTVGLSFPIFEWGKRTNKVKEQSFKTAAQQQRLEDTRELVDLEVQNAYLQLNQAAKKVRLSVLSLDQATENLKLADDRFKAGTIVGKDVQEAQVLWEQAYSSLIDAKIEYKVNEVLYRKSIGELTE